MTFRQRYCDRPGTKQTTPMTRPLGCAALCGLLLMKPALAQQDPWAGTWQGTLDTAAGETSDVSLTLVSGDNAYTGVISGFIQTTEIRLSGVDVDGMQVTLDARTDSDFGPLSLSYQLTRNDRTLSGTGRLTLGQHDFSVSLDLTRARRADVPQPQIDQQVGYFDGTWRFEYTGGEFPPLSIGTRSGTVTFDAVPHGPFVRGRVIGEVFGDPYTETWTIGFDGAARSIIWHEQLSTGRDLLALGNWTSPIAITFLTVPMETENGTYVLRRMISTTSDSAFSVTDEFSVDGGPFRRLGSGSYLRAGRTNPP